MKKTRSSPVQERPPSRPLHAAPAESREPVPAAGLVQSWTRFWFLPTDPIGLHVLRLLGGLLLTVWLLGYAGHVNAFFGLEGWFDRQALNEAVQMPGGPPTSFGWSVTYLAGYNTTLLHVIYGASLAVVILFTLGVATRLTGVLTWLAVVSFLVNPVLDYDADALLSILAFYLMVGHLLMGWRRPNMSPLNWLMGPLLSWPLGERNVECHASSGANVALRLLQVHFAIVMVTSGLHKLQFAEWWSGVALWFPLHPPFETTIAAARQTALGADLYLVLLSLATYAVLAWQLCFPTFAWRPRARVLLLGGAAMAWAGCAFLYRLPLFGPAIAVLCLSYITAREWRWLGDKLRKIPGPGKLLGKVFAPRAEKMLAHLP